MNELVPLIAGTLLLIAIPTLMYPRAGSRSASPPGAMMGFCALLAVACLVRISILLIN